MKTKVLFLALMGLTISIFAQDDTKVLSSKVTDVTVYMNGAQITHKADVTLAKGKYNLVFTGISPNINQKSIQVSGNNDIKITSITYVIDYLEPKSESNRIQSLRDSVKLLNKQIKTTENEISVFTSEKQLILKNDDLKGQNTGVQILDLQKAADFYRLRLNEINKLVEKLGEKKEDLNESLARVQKQLIELNARQNQPMYKLNVTADVINNTTTTLLLKYLVSGTGWAAYYDIRAIDVNSPLQLEYKAKVYNNCGLDWKNVKLTLSTADPSLSAEKPQLTPWTLNYANERTDYYNRDGAMNEGYLNTKSFSNNYLSADTITFTSSRKGEKKTQHWNTQYTQIQVSELSVDFDIVAPYSIPADNKIYFVDIQSSEVPATYKYFAIPKMDKDAFLVASITGWENLNLIEGSANIFFSGTYIGQSYIDTRFASDTLEISLGRDKKVAITRTKKQDYSGKNFSGSNKKEVFTYEISVRNNNKTAIDIELLDQVPITQESDIKVDVIETTGVTPEPLSGKLKYQLKLAPSESKILTLSFSVQYPKSKAKQIHLQKSRSINCPSF